MNTIRSFIPGPHQASLMSRLSQTQAPPRPQSTATVSDGVQLNSPFVFLTVGEQVVRLPGDGSSVQLGRLDQSPIKFEDTLVSRRHAEVRSRNGALEIRDSGSTNGTWLGEQKLEPGKWYAADPKTPLKFGSVPVAWSNDYRQSFKSTLYGTASAAAIQAAGAAVAGPVGTGLSLAALQQFAGKKTLENKDTLMHALAETRETQLRDSGIVELPKGVPTMVIPDVHAQRDYFTRALQHEINGEKVFDLLKSGRMNLLCLGDGMHSEGRGKDRWLQAEQDAIQGRPSKAMHDEMIESMGTMKMVMDLKKEFGDHFVYLRGNHDDMDSKQGFLKYSRRVGESNLVKDWVVKNYGGDLLKEWAGFEKSMPLVAKGTGFVASHAAPGRPLKKAEIEARSDRAFGVLAWTDNTAWSEHGQERQIFEQNLQEVGAHSGDRWFVGHRKVTDANYRGQFDDQLVQINPMDYDGFVVGLIGADGRHDPHVDTFRV